MDKMKVAVIVDAYGPAFHYNRFFNKAGYQVVHVQSTCEPLSSLTKFKEDLYVENIVYRGSIFDLINDLKKYQIMCVIAGIEPGVELADSLSEAMSVASNGTRLSKLRRNKYLMIEHIKNTGFNTPKQINTSSLTEIKDWIAENETYPIVIKPLDSAGSDGVTICQSYAEAKVAFAKIIDQTNIMGKQNCTVLLQEFLIGTEYVINTVSCHGQHFITDIWKCNKTLLEGYGFIYDTEVLLDFDDRVASELEHYVKGILTALGIEYGPCHAEVMMTESGPVIIEIGARMGGAVNPEVMAECVGYSQISLTVDAYINSQNFFSHINKPRKIKKYSLWVGLQCHEKGLSYDNNFIEFVQSLNSYFLINMRRKPNEQLAKTLDLNSSPGSINLVSDSLEVLWADYERIKSVFQVNLENSRVRLSQ